MTIKYKIQQRKIMKKLIIASLAITSISAFAQNQSGFDGFVSAGVGTNEISGYGESDNSSISTFRGTFSFAHDSGFGIQVDNVIDNQKIQELARIRTNDLALHGFYRKDNYLGGVVYQTRNFKGKVDGGSITLPVDRVFTGLEGQYDLGDVTIYAITAQDKISLYADSVTGRTNMVEARYFFNDNLRTDISFTKSKFSEGEADFKANTTAIGVEYKYNKLPFSAFVKYQNMNGSFVDTERFVVGITVNFGKDTLKSRNSSGAGLNPISLDNQLMSLVGSLPK
jgi:hypothetical protein